MLGGFKRGKVAPLNERRCTAASPVEEEGGRLWQSTISGDLILKRSTEKIDIYAVMLL